MGLGINIAIQVGPGINVRTYYNGPRNNWANIRRNIGSWNFKKCWALDPEVHI